MMDDLASEVSSFQMVKFFTRLECFGGDLTMVERLNDNDELMRCAVEYINEQLNRNPREITVQETLVRFRVQNNLGNWGFGDDVFARLADTAPPWPKGYDAYRSLRIRWGEGDEGVALTFERHAEAIKRVFPDKFWRWERLLSGKAPFDGKDVERLRLLNGNQTHKPTVEWVIINDLSANHRHTDITSVRGPNSLADEGLALVWLFPKRVRAIDYKRLPAWFCAGYELNVPEYGEEWRGVIIVYRPTNSDGAFLGANQRSNGSSEYSVPFLESAT